MPTGGKTPKVDDQGKMFIEAAHELGCDDDETHFEEMLKKVSRHKPPPDAPPNPKNQKAKRPGQ